MIKKIISTLAITVVISISGNAGDDQIIVPEKNEKILQHAIIQCVIPAKTEDYTVDSLKDTLKAWDEIKELKKLYKAPKFYVPYICALNMLMDNREALSQKISELKLEYKKLSKKKYKHERIKCKVCNGRGRIGKNRRCRACYGKGYLYKKIKDKKISEQIKQIIKETKSLNAAKSFTENQMIIYLHCTLSTEKPNLNATRKKWDDLFKTIAENNNARKPLNFISANEFYSTMIQKISEK